MRKGIMFIATALTTFVLAVLGAVVYAYRAPAVPGSVSAQPVNSQSVSLAAPEAAAPPAAATAAMVSPQQAASLAAGYINRTDLYSVELADFNGVQTYKVVFSSGDIVYVGLDGSLVAAVPPQPAVVVSASGAGQGKGASRGQGGGEGEREGGDD
jgi:hypothetical protein